MNAHGPAPAADPAVSELIAGLPEDRHPANHGGIWEDGRLMFPRVIELRRWIAVSELVESLRWVEHLDIWHATTRPDGLTMDEVQPATVSVLSYAWGVSTSRVRHILRGVPHIGRDEATDAKIYRWADAMAAKAELPGRGFRTDLRR